MSFHISLDYSEINGFYSEGLGSEMETSERPSDCFILTGQYEVCVGEPPKTADFCSSVITPTFLD